MNGIRQRNQQILQMRAQGVPRRDVARRFGLTRSRIALIEREAAAEQSLAERRTRLREEIRQADNLDKAWPVMDLIDALWLIVIARVRLVAHFERIQKVTMTLRELMDLAITQTNAATHELVRVPLLSVQGIGKYGFYSVIAELTEIDLGPRCNEEWRTRLDKLRRQWKIPAWPPNPRHRAEGER